MNILTTTTVLIFSIFLGVIVFVSIVLLILFLLAKYLQHADVSENTKSILPRIILKIILKLSRVKLIVEGKENIPYNENIVVIGNHQSNFDILALVVAFDKLPIGFIAKKSLALPWLKEWMKVIGCVFIDRSKPKETLTVLIKEAIPKIKAGKPMVLFPEGTRSKSSEMNKMNAGGLIIAKSPKATILPIALSNTHQVAKHFPWKKTIVYVRIQKPIRFEEYSVGNDYNGFMERLQIQIGKAVDHSGIK